MDDQLWSDIITCFWIFTCWCTITEQLQCSSILWHSRKYTIFNPGSHLAPFACTPHRYHISSMHGSWFQFASNSGIETASDAYQCFKPLAQNNMHTDTYTCEILLLISGTWLISYWRARWCYSEKWEYTTIIII